MRSPTRALAPALTAVLLLAACGDPPATTPRSGPPPVTLTAPATTPTPDPTPTTTPDPPTVPGLPADVPTTGPNLTRAGETPPLMPPEATAHTPAGAVAFAEFFIRTIDWGFAVTDGSYMRHYFSPRCVTCASHADSLDATSRAGHHYLGGRFLITGATATGSSEDSAIRITFDLTSVEVVDAANRFVNGGPARHDMIEDLHVLWTGAGWQVISMAAR